jgi:hypothetical protein
MRVLGFDGWTMGIHHYARLVAAFREKNIELSLLHLGSWGDEKGRKQEELINGITVRDISFYKNHDFDEILDIERPDLVLFLSTETFAHRAFHRYCRQKGIPTIYLYHGMCSVFLIDGKKEILRSTLVGQVRFVFRQAYKSIRHTFPTYARSLRKTSASFSEWMRFGHDIVSRIRGKTIFVPASDSIPAKCCVFISADIQDAVSRFKMERNHVAVVGNPDLIAFGVGKADIGSFVNSDFSRQDNVMYIDAGLASLGLNFNSVDEYAKYLVNIGSQLKVQHKNLLIKIKPHPAEYKEHVSSMLLRNGISIVENNEFVARLRTCCACITETSTLGLIPGLLGMPLFLQRTGPLNSLLYGNVFTSYPRAQYLDDVDRFNELLSAKQASCDADRVMDWIDENSGPMPAEDMPERVAAVVLDLIHTRDASIGVADGGHRSG